MIGDKLKDVSSLTSDTGQDLNKIVIFDPTVTRLQQFNLDTLQLERSLPTNNPGADHSVLYDAGGNYAIDFSAKNMTIFDSEGVAKVNPLRFVGKPKSASFRPSLGLLVVYDDLLSVGMLKLDSNGHIVKSWLTGPDFGNNVTIAAGDIDSLGRLVLGMNNGSIYVVDLEASMTPPQQWASTSFATMLEGIEWLAPVRGDSDRVLVASSDAVNLVNVTTHTVEQTLSVRSSHIVKYSKSVDPHILIKNYSTGKLQVVYVQGGAIQTKDVYYDSNLILQSRLDLVNDNWSFVDATKPEVYDYSVPAEMQGRVINSYQFSSLLAVSTEKVPDKTKLESASQSVFALYTSSPLGYAVNFDLLSGQKGVIKNFNLPYIH